MKTIDVIFLDKKYSLPYEILTYLQYHAKFEQMKQDLLSYMLRYFPDGVNLPNNFEVLYAKGFKNTANICIKELLERGIYNKTVEDYCEQNPGYIAFGEAWKKVALRQVEILQEQIYGMMAGIERAEQVANETVTGMGFNIYTNSLIDFGVWAAMENSTLRKQAREADIKYNKIIAEADTKTKNTANKKEAEINTTIWLPEMKNSVNLFMFHLFDMFLKDLIDAGKFDKTALQYINIERATALLKNVAVAPNKQTLLQEAFITCPFCLNLFTVIIKHNLFDENIRETAEKLSVLDDITIYIKEECKKICTSNCSLQEEKVIKKLTTYINASAIIEHCTTENATEKCISMFRKQRILKLKKHTHLAFNSKEFDAIIRNVISNNIDDIIDKCRNIENAKAMFTTFLHLTVIQDDNPYYDKEANETATHLANEASKYVEEAIKRRKKYTDSLQEFVQLKSNLETEIQTYITEKDKCGLFGFFKKKELDSKIQECYDKINTKEQETTKAQEDYQRMYK